MNPKKIIFFSHKNAFEMVRWRILSEKLIKRVYLSIFFVCKNPWAIAISLKSILNVDRDMDMDAKENVFSRSLYIHITLSLMNFAPNDKQDEIYSEAPMTYWSFSPSLDGLKCYTYFCLRHFERKNHIF